MSGTVSWSPETKVLKIVTDAKRGAKTVKKTEQYDVEQIPSDGRVARYTYSLTKHSDGKIYHVAMMTYGITCSCPHATFRGANTQAVCKHIKAMRAAGFFKD